LLKEKCQPHIGLTKLSGKKREAGFAFVPATERLT